jgi:hypothetical protein
MNCVVLCDSRGLATIHTCASVEMATRLACALTASLRATTATVEQPDGRTFVYQGGCYQGEVGRA